MRDITPQFKVLMAAPNSKKKLKVSHTKALNQTTPTSTRNFSPPQQIMTSAKSTKTELLDAAILGLKEDILRYETQKKMQLSLLSRTNDFKVFGVSTIRQYCALFSRGLAGKKSPQYLIQMDFLHSIMRSDVDLGDNLCGIMHVVEQWRMYTNFHKRFSFTVLACSAKESADIKAVKLHGTIKVCISRQTIAQVFPNLRQSEQITLEERILGKEVKINCFVRFFFDEQGKIHRIVPHIDYTNGLVSLCHSIEELNTILEKSSLTRQGYILKASDRS